MNPKFLLHGADGTDRPFAARRPRVDATTK